MCFWSSIVMEYEEPAKLSSRIIYHHPCKTSFSLNLSIHKFNVNGSSGDVHGRHRYDHKHLGISDGGATSQPQDTRQSPAMNSCEMLSYYIPQEMQVLLNVWAIGRDPNSWKDPLVFKPERFMDSSMVDIIWSSYRSGLVVPLASRVLLLALRSLI
ncbi:hypothetical protein HHK36_011303 [Tetracentron sinense]|uniref:Uncharacterized protein n=1 Tax=Tetracentron sinense TaxID=13715 RepID=A0A835DKA6_TETSI|nr:hypothetical protein HHK36_011303 [Tetracentron sinense]